MPDAFLPENGPSMIGPVSLPEGTRQYTVDDEKLAAWVTVEPMPDAGRAWRALSAARAQTGLVPVLLEPDPPESREPGQGPDFGFFHSANLDLLNGMPALDVLTAEWNAKRDAADVRWAQNVAPYGDRFPGLAAAERASAPPDEVRRALSTLPAAHLGLVSASRPADVPAIVGWSVFGLDSISPDSDPYEPYLPGARSLLIGSVLRSWEERFGARLLRIGADAVLQVLAERPPRTLDVATQLAAEFYAFADEIDRNAAYTVSGIAAGLVDTPIWTFGWD